MAMKRGAAARHVLLPVAVLFTAAVTQAQIIIPEPPFEPLSLKHHRVQVEIDDQVAHTAIDQLFHNPQDWDMEGTYLFPLPIGASFSAFSMEVDGEPMAAEILEADEARQIYEEIVRQLIDPGLLEYMGRDAYRARIFPIPAQGDKQVELGYDQVLMRHADVVRYVYPLDSRSFSTTPLDDVSVQVRIRSATPIKAVFSPSHPIEVERLGEQEVLAVFADEEGVVPEGDFVLYYTLSSDPVGIDLLTYFSPDEEEGFYLLLAAPEAVPSTDQLIPKRMVFVFDRSGSMEGDKIEQARAALRFAIGQLDPGDEFNIVDYGTTVRSFRDDVVAIDQESWEQALAYVDEIEALGGTNIHGALIAALAMMRGDDRAEMVVFLTDGKPTIGETYTGRILEEVGAARLEGTRVFVFGVGNEVNTLLLDQLAADNGGTTTYVEPEEDIEVAVSSFYIKVASPVLEDLELALAGVRHNDFYPQRLPDLFRGGQVTQLGRLENGGVVDVELTGQVLDETVSYSRSVDLDGPGLDLLPRLWATRKVGFLLGQIRLHGEDLELVDEIVYLSKRYGIITPYTSFLIVEDEPPAPLVEESGLRAESGADAVAASEDLSSYAGAANTTEVQSQEVRYVGEKTFYRRDGFWRDAAFEEDVAASAYRYGSEAYFDLAAARPELGRYLALGRDLLFASGGVQYRIGVDEFETRVEGEAGPRLPAEVGLEQNYPNPFNGSTTLTYRVGVSSAVRLEIFDAAGQLVRTLVSGLVPTGRHEVQWDARDDAGRSVASGTYVARIAGGAGSAGGASGRVSDAWKTERKVLLVK